MRTLLLAFALLFSSSILAQDCEGQHTFTVVIQPDAWPYEMSWELTNGDGDLLLEAVSYTHLTLPTIRLV